MSLLGPGSSNSQSTQRTQNIDQSNTASGQAIIYAPRRSGNPNSSINLRGNSELTIVNQGLGQEQVDGLLGGISDALRAVTQGTTTERPAQAGGVDGALIGTIEDRIRAVEQRAQDEIKTGSPSNILKWVLWGVAAFAVVAIVSFAIKRRKKN